MAKLLTRLKIREVSSVDRGAGDGVKIMLMKMDGEDEPYWKREFSASERHRDAKSGAAESDGSFPIHNSQDLHNAMQAIGRSKNPARTKAHIRSRARALGLTGQLSDSFKRDEPMSKIGKFFSSVFGGADSNDAVITKSVDGLAESVASILAADGDDVSKGEALTTTFEQFGAHLKSTISAEAEKGSDMDISLLRKALGLADSATEADVTKAIADLRKESVYDEEEEEKKPELSDGAKSKKKADGKDEKQPDGDEVKAKKSLEPEVPAYIQKMADELAEVKKQNADLVAKAALVGFAKQAEEVGLGAGKAELISKLYAGDKTAISELLQVVKSAHAAAAAGEVFKEFGTLQGGGTPDDPFVLLTQKADDLRKANPNLTQQQAFAKVYEDPANADLTRKERAKNRPVAA